VGDEERGSGGEGFGRDMTDGASYIVTSMSGWWLLSCGWEGWLFEVMMMFLSIRCQVIYSQARD